MNYEVDLHGLTVKQSRINFFTTFEKALKENINRVDFITGDGLIRTEIIKLLENFEIPWSYRMPNRGCIVAYFNSEVN